MAKSLEKISDSEMDVLLKKREIYNRWEQNRWELADNPLNSVFHDREIKECNHQLSLL